MPLITPATPATPTTSETRDCEHRMRFKSVPWNTLSADLLSVIFQSLSLRHNLDMKCVCTEWANAARRCVNSQGWRDVHWKNEAALLWVPGRRTQYASAKGAFASLEGGVLSIRKSDLYELCKTVAKIYGVKMDIHPIYSNATRLLDVIGTILNDAGVFKCFHIMQQLGSLNMIICCDRAHGDQELSNFVAQANSIGLEAFRFALHYPPQPIHNAFLPVRRCDPFVLNYRNNWFRSGTIVGVLLWKKDV